MFAQANSEHCRHKIFNADWIIDGERQPNSLFAMIRNTHARNPHGVLSAYRDNAAVIEGTHGERWFADVDSHVYASQRRADRHSDEGGDAQPSDRDLAIPGRSDRLGRRDPRRRRDRPRRQAESRTRGLLRVAPAHPRLRAAVGARLRRPARIASALDIMLEGPIGAAAFNNEFGRPNILGYFRTFETELESGVRPHALRGYHKPIMIAGGLGNVRRDARREVATCRRARSSSCSADRRC